MNLKCNVKNDVIKTLNSVVTLNTTIFNNNNFCVFVTEIIFVPFEVSSKYLLCPYFGLNRGPSK